MSRPTNNYDRKYVDFIKSLAEIGEPFNSTLLDGYQDYIEHKSDYGINGEKECFLSIINKMGEDGCQVLTDKIVNYIDDVSNIDTTTPKALLSQAEELSYPYKDKKIVDYVGRLSKCSPILQSLVWATSVNSDNSRTILNRLNLLDDEEMHDISSHSTDDLNNYIANRLSTFLYNNVFNKHYLYLKNKEVSSDGMPSILDFSWVINTIFANDIINNGESYSNYNSYVIDFGKYNMTLYSIVCYTYLFSKINGLFNIDTSTAIERCTTLAKQYMPFLYNNTLFDPLQAAWSIIYDDRTIDDYDSIYHESINDFIKAFNEKLNDVAYRATINVIPPAYTDINSKLVYKLNANSFTYQQQAVQLISDIKQLFSIDLIKYNAEGQDTFDVYLANKAYWSTVGDNIGFVYIDPSNDFSITKSINLEKYINDVVDAIFELGKKIRLLREDLRLMTLRNSYKGTSTLIQYSIYEYLHDSMKELLYNAKEKYDHDNAEHIEISKEDFDQFIDDISSVWDGKNQGSIGVGEYWDYTEYFNRMFDEEDEDKTSNPNIVDWFDSTSKTGFDKNGSMDDDEIYDFYANVLNIPKEILENTSLVEEDDSLLSTGQIALRTFLKEVYNLGVYTKRTNKNFEAAYSGLKKETTNKSFWSTYKNREYISKQIHPYIWNFTQRAVTRLYKSNAVTVEVQNAEYELLSKHIGTSIGNIIDQYRLSENFVDSSGYVTRYEHRDHSKTEIKNDDGTTTTKYEKTKSYDGFIYPEFGYQLNSNQTNYGYNNNVDSNWSEISSEWYTYQNVTLQKSKIEKEKQLIKDLIKSDEYKKFIKHEEETDFVLGNYCIDQYETTYGSIKYENMISEPSVLLNASTFVSSMINTGIDYFPDIATHDGNKIYLLCQPYDHNAIIIKTLDGGNHWQLTNLPYSKPRGLTTYDGEKLYLLRGGEVYKSTNGGSGWTKCPNINNTTSGIDTPDGNIIYVGVIITLGEAYTIYKSIDGGNTWNPCNNEWISNHEIYDIISYGENIVYATTTGNDALELYKSIDGGKTWIDISSNLPALPENKGVLTMDTTIASPNGVIVYYTRSCIITKLNNTTETIYQELVSFDGGNTWIDNDVSSTDACATITPNNFTLYSVDKVGNDFIVNVRKNSGNSLYYKENGYPFMRQFINNKNDSNYGMLFINADDSIDTDIIDNAGLVWDLYCKHDKFPRITISEDGTHALLRISPLEFRSYTITTHKNEYNEVEQAWKLNAIITCDSIIFDTDHFNDSLIKSVDDAFYILIPSKEDDKFCNYLIYIKKGSHEIFVSKEIFYRPDNRQLGLFASGMHANGKEILVSTYYVDKNEHISDDTTEISAVYSNPNKSKGNAKTAKENWTDSETSLDILDQFVQIYTSSSYSPENKKFVSIKVDYDTNPAQPKIDLTKDNIDSVLNADEYLSGITTVEIDSNGLLEPSLNSSTELPFTRTFNLNADAGFNPIYIGSNGKIVLSNHKKQFKLAKETGAAFELLGPSTNFEMNPSDNAENISDTNIFNNTTNHIGTRIHEFHSDDFTEVSSHAQFHNGAYVYGYSSIVENPGYEDDIYRIVDIQHRKLSSVQTDGNGNQYVTTTSQFSNSISTVSGYNYNRIYLFLGVNNVLYSLIPRKITTSLQDTTTASDDNILEFNEIKSYFNQNDDSKSYEIKFENSYIIDNIKLYNKKASIYSSKNAKELVNAEFYIVHVAAKSPNPETITEMHTPNFMLPYNELKKSIASINDIGIDHHLRAPYTDATYNFKNISSANVIHDSNIEITEITSGSLVFSINENDSDFMNKLLPDERVKINEPLIKSVTAEAFNDFELHQELGSGNRFDKVLHDFKPYQFVDLNLRRIVLDDKLNIGYNYNGDISRQYIIQPYGDNEEFGIKQDSENKYMITFWRRSEDSVGGNPSSRSYDDSILPDKIKIAENEKAIYGMDRESIGDILTEIGTNFRPQLMVQWEYENTNGAIKLRFNNDSNGDASFINPNSGMNYKSMSVFASSVELSTGESGYIDVVIPNHVIVGSTVFYNIPVMRVYVTNISDNKPKFMMTIINDKMDKQTSLQSESYALVFTSPSTPELDNSDVVYATCYLAPMSSNNQTKPPSVSNSISLSELAFNFDVANILNKKDFMTIEDIMADNGAESKSLVDIKHINAIRSDNTLSDTVLTYVSYNDNCHQIRVNDPMPSNGKEVDGFNAVDIKVSLNDMTKYSLKHALMTAHGDVIAYDKAGHLCQVVKIFGCSVSRIGAKHVLSAKPTASTEKPLYATQNSGRETAILVNPNTMNEEI